MCYQKWENYKFFLICVLLPQLCPKLRLTFWVSAKYNQYIDRDRSGLETTGPEWPRILYCCGFQNDFMQGSHLLLKFGQNISSVYYGNETIQIWDSTIHRKQLLFYTGLPPITLALCLKKKNQAISGDVSSPNIL